MVADCRDPLVSDRITKKVDYVFSLGVIHHIPNYKKACKRIYDSLKPNGKFIIWVYGYEGNELFLLIFNNIRRITRILPDSVLRIFCTFLNLVCYLYIFLCKFIKLPMQQYMLEVFGLTTTPLISLQWFKVWLKHLLV